MNYKNNLLNFTIIIYLSIIFWENIPEETWIDSIVMQVLYYIGVTYLAIKYWKQLMELVNKETKKSN